MDDSMMNYGEDTGGWNTQPEEEENDDSFVQGIKSMNGDRTTMLQVNGKKALIIFSKKQTAGHQKEMVSMRRLELYR